MTPPPPPPRNISNRTLFIADNLPILRGMNSETVDLIATDPPFNKGVKAFEGITAAGVNITYSDVWTWGDVQVEWTNDILADHPNLYSVIRAANATAGDDMGAFLCWMAVRLLEMHRILKPTGSIYLHCDPTASHYLKALMDATFGFRNFRNEIVWAYRGGGVPKHDFSRKHDIILRYSKTQTVTFNVDDVRIPYSEDSSERLNYVARSFRGDRTYDTYEPHPKGKHPEDWWPMQPIMPSSKERRGYPTQKPLALYERIIKASSNPNDVVLDPFAGCATTCVAAERLGRQWIGIDLNEPAREIIHERLQSEVSANMAWGEIVQTPSEPPERTDGGDTVAPELVVVSRRKNARRLPVREIRERLIITDKLRCQGCGWVPPYSDYLQVDHKKPRSLGGTDDMDNLTLLCDPCNRLKSNKLTLTELRQTRLFETRMDMDWWEDARWR